MILMQTLRFARNQPLTMIASSLNCKPPLCRLWVHTDYPSFVRMDDKVFEFIKGSFPRPARVYPQTY